MKFILAALSLSLLPLAASAGILPDQIGAYHRTASSKPALGDQAVWNDYGLKNSETANYENGATKFTATAWQLQDTTASLAAFDWQRPADAKPAKLATLAAETGTSLIVVHGQYLVFFDGYKPAADELQAVWNGLKNLDSTQLPVLPSYLPSAHLVANSERYVVGPASLAKFYPVISSTVAGFHFGAEAQTGVFHSPKGDMTVAIFNYPTPQIAMDKVSDFQKVPAALVKRSGPFVAVAVAPADPEMAEELLSDVRYQAQITRDEYVPTKRDNMGDLLLNICILIGILLGFALLSGLLFGGLKYLTRAFRKGPEPEPMITLHLE